jgi:hypothetical protein
MNPITPVNKQMTDSKEYINVGYYISKSDKCMKHAVER